MTTGEKLERSLNFLQQLFDSMNRKLDPFESKIGVAVIDELIDVLKIIKGDELIIKSRSNKK